MNFTVVFFNNLRSRIGREVRVNTGQRAENENLRRQQIHELAQDMSNAEAELAGIRRECNQLEPELRKRQEDLKHLKDAIRDLKLEMEVCVRYQI
jgi:predicted nuclease with TOPRIM domain